MIVMLRTRQEINVSRIHHRLNSDTPKGWGKNKKFHTSISIERELDELYDKVKMCIEKCNRINAEEVSMKLNSEYFKASKKREDRSIAKSLNDLCDMVLSRFRLNGI